MLLVSLLTAVLFTTSPAPLVNAEGIALDAQGREPDEAPMWGLQLEAGLPDGVGASMMANPTRWLRVHIAGLTNGAGAGVRFGVTFSPLGAVLRYVRPILGVDAGWFFNGDATWLPGVSNNPILATALKDVSYGFANAQAGFEFGSKYVSFVIRGGLSYLDITLGNPTVDLTNGATLSIKGLGLRGLVPSARVGLMFCFF